MRHQTFEIFVLKSNQTAVFLESVSGLSAARERMAQIAANTAGRYILASAGDRVVIARTETFKQALSLNSSHVGPSGAKGLGTAPDLNGTHRDAAQSKTDPSASK